MICSKCEAVGKDLVKSLTNLERMHVLASTVAMLRSIESGRNDTQDKIVANSVLTKFLLSYDIPSRMTLLEHFRKGVGMDIKLGSCAHGLTVVQ